MTERDFILAIRAAKIRRAKLLEQLRAVEREEIAAYEQYYGIAPNDHTRQVVITNGDSIATAAIMTDTERK